MVDVKEIKSLKLTPFTRMSASIYGILGLIAAIVMLIALIIVQAAGLLPQLGQFNLITGLGIPLIVLLPIGAFFSTIMVSFFSVMLYNVLVPKLGGVKLELEGNEVEKIPIVSFSLILSAIGAIWAFIVGLVLAAVFSPLFSFISTISTMPAAANITANITNVSGAAMPTGAEVGVAGTFVFLVLIIGLPIMVFVFGFIWNALFALFYNYIVTRVAKIQLEFNQITGSLHELKHIPVLPTALAVAIVCALLGIISGIISGNYGEFISNFITYFIETALIALLYNYLAPKIGSIKLNLE
ncbi:hypothetical protein [Methanobacterium petrolearium]|uniref:hypothetical protein n=1 Tax=Methanobacterium petrolearium TaxID=710190 RepID=UPI001AE69C47|nr:hypothetical protein [Methanobacterium petrolearium]MBP1946542.1 beta-lactamase regulating signal transducer with metallopeptidase domain [Methanobacterium petrolearium]BDZ69887.1 hypothetical protein GCM10025861_04040 [Methanobacterium petrolearium]